MFLGSHDGTVFGFTKAMQTYESKKRIRTYFMGFWMNISFEQVTTITWSYQILTGPTGEVLGPTLISVSVARLLFPGALQ